jgi:hypothetical protein
MGQVMARIPDDHHKVLKIMAAEEGTTIQAILADLIREKIGAKKTEKESKKNEEADSFRSQIAAGEGR